MLSLPKLALVSLVVIAIGALQQAVPAFTSEPSLPSNNQDTSQQPLKIAVVSNQVIPSDYDAKNGTLYLTSTEENTATPVDSSPLISPLLNTKVDIKVNGIVARTKLTQTFKNASNNWADGMYVFPLPENAAVDHLIMTIGERKIEGQIKEKSQAKQLFNKAKSAGKKVSLVAQHRPNVFSNKIANIGPNETIVISIEYQQTLNLQAQEYSLRFPMTVAPRYSPRDTNTQAPPELPQGDVKGDPNIQLAVHLQAGFDLEHINSEFHPITQQRLADGSYKINLQSGHHANQDFVLTWRPELGANPQVAHLTQHINGSEYGLIMVNGPNSKDTILNLPREVIFVLDTSGSMEGESIIQAKQALLLAIQQLSAKDTFNIIEFNSRSQNLWRTPQKANAVRKQQATDFVSDLAANGGTEMHSALDLAFAQSTHSKSSADMSQIIFITDGSVSNEASLMSLIENKINNSRLFTVGIGSAPNTYFMTEAAQLGRGTFTYIGSTQQVQLKMQQLLSKIQHPTLTDIELLLTGTSKDSKPQLEMYPKTIPDLYFNEPLILSYKLTQQAPEVEEALDTMTLTAKYQGQDWVQVLPHTTPSRQSGLDVLWARNKIRQLTQDKRRAQMTEHNSDALQKEYQAQITATALTHHVVSQYTSLIAIDVTPTKPITDKPDSQKAADLLAKGTKEHRAKLVGSLPQTATAAELKLILGLFILGLAICMHLLTKRNIHY
ncbi:marine proteobacterial sortase target protein [Paraglaciecola sp. 2405UD69-4]|uniref:marine proteobacterial sortase target protein n=1 Tax=Paraglaciecola sp. 2405UD69-4 TaxID=3391836 RepID=UPI0039C98422